MQNLHASALKMITYFVNNDILIQCTFLCFLVKSDIVELCISYIPEGVCLMDYIWYIPVTWRVPITSFHNFVRMVFYEFNLNSWLIHSIRLHLITFIVKLNTHNTVAKIYNYFYMRLWNVFSVVFHGLIHRR